MNFSKTALAASLTALLAISAFADFRTWTKSTGSSFEAKILSAETNSVVFMRSDGRKSKLTLDRLAKADQDHILEQYPEVVVPKYMEELLALIEEQRAANKIIEEKEAAEAAALAKERYSDGSTGNRAETPPSAAASGPDTSICVAAPGGDAQHKQEPRNEALRNPELDGRRVSRQ